MQYKVERDPVTGRVLSCTLIRENTPVYSDDLIVEADGMPDISALPSMAVTDGGEFSPMGDTCGQEMDAARGQLAELNAESDADCFFRLVLEGEGMEEARQAVMGRKAERERLEKELEKLEEGHKKHIREYYTAKDREADEALSFVYYSAAILLVKDENRYLREWLDWHLALGFSHIYIYDNGTKERVSEIVGTCPEDMQGKITVIDWSGHHAQIQQDAYNHFLGNYRQEVRWGIFIDSDEFVRFTDGETADVNDFLKQYEDFTEIWGPSVEYNANGRESYEALPVRERFTETADVNEGKVYKHFIQVNRIDRFIRHFAQYNGQKHFMFRNGNDNRDLFVIDHYYTKSWEEWKYKIMERGVCDPTYRKRLSEFFLYNPGMKYLDDGTEVVQAYEGGL